MVGRRDCQRVDLRDLNAFWEKALPQDNVANSLVRSPCQFQTQMNTINMFNIAVVMPVQTEQFAAREAELEKTAHQLVLLASEFPLVGEEEEYHVQEIKTIHFVNTFREVLAGEEKMQIIWVNNQYCLLKFPSPNTCDAAYQLWEQGKQQGDVADLTTENKIPMYQFKLQRFDGYEEVCGMEHKETAHPDLKRAREGEVKESSEKRYRLLSHWGKPSKCCIYYTVGLREDE